LKVEEKERGRKARRGKRRGRVREKNRNVEEKEGKLFQGY